MEQAIDSVLLFVPFDYTNAASPVNQQIQGSQTFALGRDFPLQSFNMSGSSVQTRFSQTCTAKRPFCHCTSCLTVPASAGGAQSRCTRTVFAGQVVSHRAVFERSIERFRVGIRALEDACISDRVNGNRRAG